jgi:hypothetical protein
VNNKDTWEDKLLRYVPSYKGITGGIPNNIEIVHTRRNGGHLYSEGGFLLAPYLYVE